MMPKPMPTSITTLPITSNRDGCCAGVGRGGWIKRSLMQVRRAFQRGEGGWVGPDWRAGGGLSGRICEQRCTGRRSKKPSGQPVSSKPNVFASSFCEVARDDTSERLGGGGSWWRMARLRWRWCGGAVGRRCGGAVERGVGRRTASNSRSDMVFVTRPDTNVARKRKLSLPREAAGLSPCSTQRSFLFNP